MKVPMFTAQTEWIEPEEFPDLRSYDEIAVDLETRDPDLKSKGSGAVIGNGEVVGIAVAVSGRKYDGRSRPTNDVYSKRWEEIFGNKKKPEKLKKEDQEYLDSLKEKL